MTMAQSMIDQLCAGENISDVLAKVGAGCKQVRAGTGGHLALFYTDFEPDDLQAVAQLWQWMLESGELAGEPLIIFCADPAGIDGGQILAKKILMASLALGTDRFFTLAKSMRHATIEGICKELIRFNGDRIDLFIMAPGHGNLSA